MKVGLGVFLGLPNNTRFTDFNEFGTKKYKEESICQSLGPFIYIHSFIHSLILH